MNLYDDIMKSLEQAIEFEKGNLKVKTVKMTIQPLTEFNAKDVKNIRLKANLSQAAFAGVLGVSKKTVEAWESGRNQPNGSSSRLLELMAKDPEFPNKSGIYSVK